MFRPAQNLRASAGYFVHHQLVGQFEPHKGIGDLLAAARRGNCTYLMVGTGSLRHQVKQEAERRPGQVELHPWVPHEQLPDFLARMDVLCLPSLEVQLSRLRWIRIRLAEQFGRVLAEAMACGVPVVGSDAGEIPHVVGSAGLIFAAGDVAALAGHLNRLRADPELRRSLGEAGGPAACDGVQLEGDRRPDVRSLVGSGESRAAPARTGGGHPPLPGTGDAVAASQQARGRKLIVNRGTTYARWSEARDGRPSW